MVVEGECRALIPMIGVACKSARSHAHIYDYGRGHGIGGLARAAA